MDLVMADAIAIAHEADKLTVDLWRMQKVRTADLAKAIPTTAAVLAETLLRSPRKVFIFIINKNIYRIKVSKNKRI